MTTPTGTPAQHDVQAALLAHLHTRQAEYGQAVSTWEYALIAGLVCLAAELTAALGGQLIVSLLALLVLGGAILYGVLAWRGRSLPLRAKNRPSLTDWFRANDARDLPALLALRALPSAALRQEHQALRGQILPLRRRFEQTGFISVIGIVQVSVLGMALQPHRLWIAGLLTAVMTGLCVLRFRQLDTLDVLELDVLLLRKALLMQGQDPDDEEDLSGPRKALRTP